MFGHAAVEAYGPLLGVAGEADDSGHARAGVAGDGDDDVRGLVIALEDVVEKQFAAAADDAQRRRGKSGSGDSNGKIAVGGRAEVFDIEQNADDCG
jgi:hypothetical protein